MAKSDGARSESRLTRRDFMAVAAAAGAALAWAGKSQAAARTATERRDLFAEGVASGDPDATSVLLWTRRPFPPGALPRLRVEVSEDEAFDRVVAVTIADVSAAADWTCRVLVGNLKPASLYWFRFIDDAGNASRVGRTMTAPAEADARAVKFAFLSCQMIGGRVLNTYRRMILDDVKAVSADQLNFVLHLGDFAYKQLYYPEDNPGGYFGGRLRDVGRFPHGRRLVGDGSLIAHAPATLEDYRVLYQIYLRDPDLQDARARWPFVCIWDNGEFAWEGGHQTVLYEEGRFFPAQSQKVMANQAWFEYMPARVRKASGPSLARFDPPRVEDAPLTRSGIRDPGDEPNNRAALASLTAYRTLRFGANVELLVTDQWSYRTPDAAHEPDAKPLETRTFERRLFDQRVLAVLDAGRNYNDGNPPHTIRFGDTEVPNFRKDGQPQSLLGAEQKSWFLDRLSRSRATWKIWGSSLAAFEFRLDLQNLPDASLGSWPSDNYAMLPARDYGVHFCERAEIFAHIRRERIGGFAIVSGDRHSFWAGFAAPALPPDRFEPVGVAFVTGAVSTYTAAHWWNLKLAPDDPLRKLYLGRLAADGTPELTANMLMRHGVESTLEYGRTGDLARARALSNSELAPHLRFVDFDGNGYSTVRATHEALECMFVSIPAPLERDTSPEGPPVKYRVRHHVPLWKAGETPHMEQTVLEGNPELSL